MKLLAFNKEFSYSSKIKIFMRLSWTNPSLLEFVTSQSTAQMNTSVIIVETIPFVIFMRSCSIKDKIYNTPISNHKPVTKSDAVQGFVGFLVSITL